MHLLHLELLRAAKHHPPDHRSIREAIVLHFSFVHQHRASAAPDRLHFLNFQKHHGAGIADQGQNHRELSLRLQLFFDVLDRGKERILALTSDTNEISGGAHWIPVCFEHYHTHVCALRIRRFLGLH